MMQALTDFTLGKPGTFGLLNSEYVLGDHYVC